jgi:hypothetical protein
MPIAVLILLIVAAFIGASFCRRTSEIVSS